MLFRLWRRWEEKGGQVNIRAPFWLYALLKFTGAFSGGCINGGEDKKGKGGLPIIRDINIKY